MKHGIRKNPHAVALGRLGGARASAAQAEAARKNGRLGGRPKKVLEQDKKGRKEE